MLLNLPCEIYSLVSSLKFIVCLAFHVYILVDIVKLIVYFFNEEI